MLRGLGLLAVIALCGCSSMRPIAVASPSSPHLMAGDLVHARLVSDQAEILAARHGKNRTTARKAWIATEASWETYSEHPTIENWANLQTVGTTLDVTLRKMRGQLVGGPGTLPPCVTMKEAPCRERAWRPAPIPQPEAPSTPIYTNAAGSAHPQGAN
jgi:hypothetical protein